MSADLHAAIEALTVERDRECDAANRWANRCADAEAERDSLAVRLELLEDGIRAHCDALTPRYRKLIARADVALYALLETKP